MRWPFAEALRHVVANVSRKEFASLRGRLSPAELGSALHGYGRTFVVPPDEAFDNLDVVTTRSAADPSDGEAYSVNVPLWTVEEGRSDLTLRLTVHRVADGYRIEIDDLHVL